jgi:hypothetical protein
LEKLIRKEVKASKKKTKKQWVCYREGEPEQWIRFVPCPAGDEVIFTGGSTELRDTIASCPPEQLCARLEGKALNAEILVEFVQEAQGLQRHSRHFRYD